MSSIVSASNRFSLPFSLAIVLGPMADNGSIQRLQPLGVRQGHAAELALAGAKRAFRHAMLAAQIRALRARLTFVGKMVSQTIL